MTYFKILVSSLLCLYCAHHVKSEAYSNNLRTREDRSNVLTSVLQGLPLAIQHGFNGGKAGFLAGFVQVITLMWLRTVVNYQYRYQKTMNEAIVELYSNGGALRFYKGLSFAIVQGPLSKFGAIAANEFAGIVFQDKIFATALGSVLSALWRVFLMPIDTCKTVLQVGGSTAYANMMRKVLKGDVLLLYEGTAATMLSTVVSHYPWFLVHNLLDSLLPTSTSYSHVILRSAFIGFFASFVSDSVSNVLRVIKTIKQSSSTESFQGELSETKYSKGRRMSYLGVVKQVIAEGGYGALFVRGLSTRLLSNAVQSVLFTIVWKLVEHSSNGIEKPSE